MQNNFNLLYVTDIEQIYFCDLSRKKNTKFSRHCELAPEVVILQLHRNVVLYH